jgi:hypothetical protein
MGNADDTYAFGIHKSITPIAITGMSCAAIGIEDMVVWIELDCIREELDCLAVVLGSEGFVSCVFECVNLMEM